MSWRGTCSEPAEKIEYDIFSDGSTTGDATPDQLCHIETQADLTDSLDILVDLAHENAKRKGFHEDDPGDGHYIALMHGELSEALEASRHGNPQSEHIPNFSAIAEEMADILIRVFDYCGKRNIPLGEAVLAKMKYNSTRPYRHGKHF